MECWSVGLMDRNVAEAAAQQSSNPLLQFGLVGMKSAALFASRMSNERSADELHPPPEAPEVGGQQLDVSLPP